MRLGPVEFKTPDSMIGRRRATEISVLHALMGKYGETLPFKTTIREHGLLCAWVFVLSIPGASKEVLISYQDIANLQPEELSEKVIEEVMFAAYQLLDENEDE